MNKLFLIFFCCLISACASHVIEHGQRIGTIIKLSDEGVFFKTHTIELIKGGINDGNGSFGVKPIVMTVRDEETWVAAQNAFASNKQVTIIYHQEMSCIFDGYTTNENGSENSCYFVEEIT